MPRDCAASFLRYLLYKSDLGDLARLDRLVAAKHRLDGLLVPLEVDERRLLVADAIDKLVDKPDPLVEVRILHGVAVVRSAVVIDVRAEAVARDHSLLACDCDIHLHTLGEALPARPRNFELLLQAAPRRIEEERRSVLHLADRHEHILHLEAVAQVRRHFGVDIVKRAAGQVTNEVEDVRVVAQSTALEAFIALLEALNLAEARLGVSLPRERPHGRERDVRGLERFYLADRAVGDELLQAADNRVVVHLKLDLADDAGLVAHLDHRVVFVHVESGDLHRKDVDSLLGAPLHLLEVPVVRGGDDNRFNVGMLFVHLLGIEVARDSRLVEFIDLLRILILGAGSDPIELLVVQKRLIVFAGMAVSHAHHCDFNRFHSFLA